MAIFCLVSLLFLKLIAVARLFRRSFAFVLKSTIVDYKSTSVDGPSVSVDVPSLYSAGRSSIVDAPFPWGNTIHVYRLRVPIRRFAISVHGFTINERGNESPFGDHAPSNGEVHQCIRKHVICERLLMLFFI